MVDQALDLFLDNKNAFVVAIVLTMIAIALCKAFYKKSKNRKARWRINASKKWLKEFRSSSQNYSEPQKISYLRNVDCYMWEEIIMTCLEERGYQIRRTPYSHDNGSDGEFLFEGEWVVIQAKRYSGNIAKEHVVKLCELVLSSNRFQKGLFVHTGKTSKPVLSYARKSTHIEILSGVSNIIDLVEGNEIRVFNSKLVSIG